ncbi:MAG: hypothetical protein OEM67_07275 [Thermoleophilia bacterium]|nr:hypothetical protein [Thermoleophilia bacterium]
MKRWRFATPVSRVSVESANPEGSRIALCGDAVADALGLDAVLMSGRRAASVLTIA